MKFSTQAGNMLHVWPRLKTLLVVDIQLPFVRVDTRKAMKRINLTFALLFFAFVQMSFAVPITGRVTDETGSPLSGVSVTLKGTSTGASTTADGKYSINVPDLNGTLTFSFVGYTAQDVPVNGRNSIDVRLAAGANTLNDVVVVGYGRQKKVNLVGSVSQVNVDEKLTNRAVPNVSSALSGLVPGLSAIQSSGMAGNNSASLIIRGLGTVNNAGPLVVVDGMPDVDINRINMNDIETISVLKDATSASVYGSRAANGVILITTRTGKGKKPSITFSSNSSLTTPTKGMKFMADYPRALTLHQRRAFVNTLAGNQTFRNGTIDQWMALGKVDPVAYPNTDWFDVIMRNGTFQNYNLAASGGNESSNFFASIGLKDEKGLQINNNFKQYNARFNFDYKVRKNMNVGVRFTGNWSNYQYALAEGFTDPDPNNTAGTDMQYAIAGILPYDPKSGYFGGVQAYGEDPQAYNPYTLYINNLNHTNRQEVNTSMYYDWSPIEGLTGRIDYALNYYNDFRWDAATPNQAYNFQTKSFGSRTYVGQNAGITNQTRTGYKTLMNARLNYIKKFNQDHEIGVLFVYSEEYWNDRFQSSSRNDRFNPSLTEIDAALTINQSTGGNSSSEGLRSYIGRLNYTAFNKYLLEANFRSDGSSKFLEGSRFGFFPSVALGWRFTEEKFIRSVTEKFLNSGKLRVSYGSLGNNSSVGRYEQLETLGLVPYVTNTNIQVGFGNSKMINRFLSWETSTVLNAGLDLTFLNNRLTATLDYYDRLTSGMIRPSQMSILLTGAYNAPRTNIGDLRNRGVEGDFSWRDRIGKFQYGASLNVSYNRSTLEKWNEFIGRGATFGNNQIFVGMPFDFVYAYETDGIAQTWQDVYNHVPQGIAPGDIMRKDLNGDGRITGDDRKAYPNLQTNRPTTSFALNLNGSWKGFDLAVLLQGSAGRKDFWLTAYNNMNFGTQRYASTWDLYQNTWSPENRLGPWPRLGGPGSNRDESIFWLDDMSFLRFKNIQLGYTVPSKMLRRIGVTNLHIVGSAENLGTLTSYRGLDPEKQGDNNNLYPINKSYSIAVNLSF
ncbi:SusC/RagA family TonB-linked outer membrane protein [Segetibacter aerophilus]|uniref:SusC/RagA family TonB-linked outer membrane protein n=1 Tax=Segetibacter aerophilus TaxID=670293 RepID=A0A512B9P6_9BACT|nr:TonB-dependent receptor [Segetibacter aerophilus]GEO08669.1 SusC/RagA family TonB-linked outer membrane protein [Segetibacter aerophilus]